MKILTLGNSHAIDAMTMLYEVWQKQNPGAELTLGIMYYSGCPIDKHNRFTREQRPAYQYYKLNNAIYNETGKWQIYGTQKAADRIPEEWKTKERMIPTDPGWVLFDGWTIDEALKDEPWDFVVVQQMNNYAFFPEHYENGELEWHIDHILKTVSSTPKLAFHNTWPNPMDETYLKACRLGYWADNMEKWYGTGVGLWNEDLRAMQRKMHTGMVENTVKYIESRKEAGIFEHVLFSGAAVQYSFEKLGLPNSKLYRDYTHLSNYSRLMIAYYWYCKFNGLTQLKQEDIRVEKMPKEFMFLAEEWVVTQQEKADIAAAVTFALQTPYQMPWE